MASHPPPIIRMTLRLALTGALISLLSGSYAGLVTYWVGTDSSSVADSGSSPQAAKSDSEGGH